MIRVILLIFQGDILEDPANEPKEDMYMMSVSPENAPSKPEYVIILLYFRGPQLLS
jgi:argininosuccinate synthase